MESHFTVSDNFNIYYNLAVEEYLLENLRINECILFLYKNRSSVILGRNQNPWAECRVDELIEQRISIARRISGGGAVYQDLGNLNYSFIMDKKIYNLDKTFEVVLSALKSLGIPAQRNDKNDLIINGLKISGNAFVYKKDKVIHHGTLLVSSDIPFLKKILNGVGFIDHFKGTHSRSSIVTNLCSYNKSINMDIVQSEIVNSFRHIFTPDSKYIPIKSIENVMLFKELYRKNMSFEWLFGKTPEYFLILNYKDGFNTYVELRLHIVSGRISDVEIHSDCLSNKKIIMIKNIITGQYFFPSRIEKVISDIFLCKQLRNNNDFKNYNLYPELFNS